MTLKEFLAFCDDKNAMITIVREDGQQLEYGHYPFYDVVSFGVHNGELYIRISAEPNPAEKEKFYSIGRKEYEQS